MDQSANVRGPGDNAHAESFFHSLKAELTRGVTFASEHTLRTELRRYMRYYNTIRLHSGLAYLSPLAFQTTRRVKTIGVNESGARSQAIFGSGFAAMVIRRLQFNFRR